MSTFERNPEPSSEISPLQRTPIGTSEREQLSVLLKDLTQAFADAGHSPVLQGALPVLRCFERDLVAFARPASPDDLIHISQVSTDGDTLNAYVVAEDWFRALKNQLVSWQSLIFASEQESESERSQFRDREAENSTRAGRTPATYDIAEIEIKDNGFGQSIIFYPYDGQYELSIVSQSERDECVRHALHDSITQQLLESGIPKECLFRSRESDYEYRETVDAVSFVQVSRDIESLILARQVSGLAGQSDQFWFLNVPGRCAEWIKGVCPEVEHYQQYSEEQLASFQHTISMVLSKYAYAENGGVPLQKENPLDNSLLVQFFAAPINSWERVRLYEADPDDGTSVTFQNETETAFLNIFFEYEHIMSMAIPKVSLGIRVMKGEKMVSSHETDPGLVGVLLVDLISRAKEFSI